MIHLFDYETLFITKRFQPKANSKSIFAIFTCLVRCYVAQNSESFSLTTSACSQLTKPLALLAPFASTG